MLKDYISVRTGILIVVALFVLGIAAGSWITERTFLDDYTLTNCIQIGEETLNGETATFYTCEGIR